MTAWDPFEQKPSIHSVRVHNGEVNRGDRVVLRPRSGGDIMDLALTGRVAMVESIEQDFEDRVHIAVILDEDPGRDLGMLRQPGHRFFFSPEEVELIAPHSSGPVLQ